MGHTPTPWRIADYGHVVGPDGSSPLIVKGFMLTRGTEAEANAAFIVKAVNAHETLVSRLQNCVDALTFCINGWDESDPFVTKLRATRDAARTALESVRETA